MNDSSFGMVQRFPERELCELKFTPIAVFVMIRLFFSSSALSPTEFTNFFLDGGSYFFQSLIKSTLLAGKDLLCLDDKQNNNGRWYIRNFSSHI